MILGLEIVLTLGGLYLLILGKGWGKDAPKHWQFRLLGGFMLTLFPVAIFTMLIVGIAYTLSHPDLHPNAVADKLRIPGIAIEVGFVLVYAITASLWDKAIRRKFTAAAAAPAPIGTPVDPSRL